MAEQGGQKEGAPKKTNDVRRILANLLLIGGTMATVGTGFGLYEAGKHSQDTINRYGVELQAGSEFSPWEYEVIMGKLAVKESGEFLGNPDTSVNVYVAGNLIEIKRPPILVAKSSVTVFPQSNAKDAREIAGQITKDLKRQIPSEAFEPVAIPGFTTPTVK